MTNKKFARTVSIVEAVTENGLCTGCGLCESIAPKGDITVEMNASGYLRPRVNNPLNSAVEQKIADVCPGLVVQHAANTEAYHPIWGPLIKSFTGYATDAEIRKQGSSGGVISGLANYLIESGKVDFVAQIAVSKTNPLTNELQISKTRFDVIKAAGSRYAPSAPLKTLRDLLSTGQKFAFIGKPCDVAALRRLSELDQSVKAQIPYMLSFMCAGIPSIQGTYDVLEQLGADSSKVVSFRYRGDGWPGMTKAIQNDGKTFEMDYNSSWGNILGKQLQFRCKICPDGTGEFADVVCADAWYGKDGYPDFTERDGRSLILTRTKAGAELLTSALASGAVEASTLAVDEIAKMQPYQVDRKRMVWGRTLATRLATGIAPKYRGLGLFRAALQTSPIKVLRSAWGTYKRANGEPQ